jgi:hypothetical protein
MRIEYEVYQRLVWDATFRRSVAASSVDDLQSSEPSCRHWAAIIELAGSPGIAEEAYRRTASLYKVSAEIFSNAHPLFIARFGNVFFERILATFFDEFENVKGTIEILEPFDACVAGSRVLRAVREAAAVQKLMWLFDLAAYDSAIWHASRVATGWPAIEHHPPLSPGVSLVSAQYDLPSLLREVTRLRRASVGSEIFRERIRPAPGWYYGVVLPKDGEVMQAKVDADTFVALQNSIECGTQVLQPELQRLVYDLGIVVSNETGDAAPNT